LVASSRRPARHGVSRLSPGHFASTAAHSNHLGEMDQMILHLYLLALEMTFLTGEMGDNQPEGEIRCFSMLLGPVSYERDVVGSVSRLALNTSRPDMLFGCVFLIDLMHSFQRYGCFSRGDRDVHESSSSRGGWHHRLPGTFDVGEFCIARQTIFYIRFDTSFRLVVAILATF